MTERKEDRQKIIKIHASTPKEFEETLVALKQTNSSCDIFVSLSISDPNILICPFHFKDIPANKIKPHILAEAIEIMSTPGDDLFVDYQIFETDSNELKGIYSCSKRVAIWYYRNIAYRHNVVLISITEYFLGLINNLAHNKIDLSKNVAVLDLGKQGCINLGVIKNNSCEFLRKLPYETPEEAELEIARSLKFACAQSTIKSFDTIYFVGPKSIHKDLIENIEKTFSTKVQMLEGPEQSHIELEQKDFFDINLIRNQTLSIKRRKTISLAFKAVLAIFVLVFLFNLNRIIKLNSEIKDIRSTYTEADKNNAQELLKHSGDSS